MRIIKYPNLTLTRVVFEFYLGARHYKVCLNLTLTRVVFEFIIMAGKQIKLIKFNFNKSCI